MSLKVEHAAEGRASSSTVERAVDLLAAATEAATPLTLGELAERANLAKPTAHRILQTLISVGLLRQDADRSYRVGARLFAIAAQVLASVEYADEARDGLTWLQSVTPETIHFAAINDGKLMYVAELEGSRPYRMASTVGTSLPYHSSGVGKAVLAFLPEEERERLLASEPLEPRTTATITDAAALAEELAAIRRQGFALDDGEHEQDVRCVAAPVFNAHGAVIGGVSVSAPTFHLSREQAGDLAPAVIEAAAMISRTLGAPNARPAR